VNIFFYKPPHKLIELEMAKPASVLYVSTEVSPFAKTGGLADVANSLPVSLFNSGVEVRVVMPKYGFISERRSRLHEVIRLKDIPVSLNGETRKINVRVGVLPETRVQVYFIDNEEFFKRDSLYTNPKTQSDYEDNHIRFAFFAKSIFEMLKRLGWQPNLIHCNEWHTGLIPLYLKSHYHQDEFFSHTKTLFTVHNTAYQGIFPASHSTVLDIPSEFQNEQGVLHNGSLNFLKTGVQFSEFVNTISDFYAKETKTNDEMTGGLSGVFESKGAHYSGIGNGIDYKTWNPETDSLIPANYSFDHLTGKTECKKAIVEKLGLPFHEHTPVLGIVTRMVDLKGIDLMVEAIPDLLQKEVQVVFMGQGEEKYQKVLEQMKSKYPGKMGIMFSHDQTLAHLVFSGADIFLMPSRFETSATSHLQALRYGTVPVVKETGSLADTIVDAKENPKSGNGFKFREYSKAAFLESVGHALELFKNREKWLHIMKAGMHADHSWENTALGYQGLYKKILKEK